MNLEVTETIRARLVELLRAADGIEDVNDLGEDGIAFYDEESGHEYFVTVEPA